MNDGTGPTPEVVTLDSSTGLSRAAFWTVIGFGAAMVLLAQFFPRTGDDWAWGSSIGLERLDNRFAGYNGRYLGNLAVLALTRADWLVPFVVAMTMCLLVWWIADLGGQRDVAGLLASGALMMAMPLAVWKQSVVWVAGFSNYALGCVVLLAFLRSIRNDFAGRRLSRLSGLSLTVLAVGGQLFIEHVTIFIVVASLAWMAVSVLRADRRLTPRVTIWTVGSLAGAAIMFSNSAYWRAATNDSQYQQLGGATSEKGSTFFSILAQGTGGVSQLATAANTVLNASLFILILGLTSAARCKGPLRARTLLPVVLAGLGMVSGVAVSSSVETGHTFGSLTRWSWIPALSLLLALLFSARYLLADRRRSVLVVSLCFAVLMLIAPMAVVTPYGPRNFFPSYVLTAVMAMLLLAELRAHSGAATTAGTVVGLSAALLGVMIAHYATTYRAIDQAADQRLAEVRQAVQQGRASVRIRTLPYPDYVHAPDPTSGVWEQRYKLFYGISPGIEIRLVNRYARRDLNLPR